MLLVLLLLAATSPAPAQAVPPPLQQHPVPEPARWQWRFDGNLIAGFNYQYRKFWDFRAVESQNWFMVAGDRAAGTGRFSITTMFSLERLTMRRLGSPQVFQTGETLDGGPLIDYQHPHDFVMNLGGRFDRPVGRLSTYLGVYVVGEPTIGPVPFMHRASADGNPQVPLGHHFFDATHITPGVLKGGVRAGPARFEASWFRGREPDENRWDLDLARPDSWAVRGSWSAGPWTAQVSGGHFTQPEAFEPYDTEKINASVSYTGTLRGRPLATTVAWGQKREFYGIKDAYLAEASWQPSARVTLYTRGELVVKNILTAGGNHPIGFTHPHINSRLGALTIGWMREVARGRYGQAAIGGDVTGYLVSVNLADSYGQPWSFHAFLRLRPASRPVTHPH